MAGDFQVEESPDERLWQEVAALAPENHTLTPNFSEARRMLGDRTFLLTVRQGKGLACAALALISTRARLFHSLTIPSIQDVPIGSEFWTGLNQLARTRAISFLNVDTFGSRAAIIPQLPREESRIARQEYFLDLNAKDLDLRLHQGHRRHIKKARNLGLTVRRTQERSALDRHVQLMIASLSRRRERGEDVAIGVGTATLVAYLKANAAELFQTTNGKEVIASALVLRSHRGAYYQSAGISPDGMRVGASHLLVHSIALQLQEEGKATFGLGGVAGDNPGLKQFKSGFGTATVDLENVTAHAGPRWRHAAFKTLRGARSAWRWPHKILEKGA